MVLTFLWGFDGPPLPDRGLVGAPVADSGEAGPGASTTKGVGVSWPVR